MRVLIFGANYEPDLGPSAPIFTMLCENLVRRGHQVTMLTMVPHYPSGRVAPEYRGTWLGRTIENGVEVIRVGLPSVDRARLPQRLIQYLVYQLGAAWAGLGRQYEVVFAGSSSLSAWLPFITLVGLRNKPAVYGVYDVYPGVGVALGVFRHKPIIKLVSSMERYCLEHAQLVRIISETFRDELRDMGVPDGKMVHGYDWVDTHLIQPLPRNNAFAREQGLDGKFVVLYAGNLGLSQGLEQILAAADLLRANREIRFVFVGDGASRASLMAEAARRQLENVQFLPYQPRPRLPEVLASADLSLVTLQRGIGSRSLPSKTYSIFASGRPLLASVEDDSEAWKLIHLSGGGVCVPPENPSALAAAVLNLKQDPARCAELGRRGRLWAEAHHSPMAGALEVEKLLTEAIAIKNGQPRLKN